LVQGAKKSFTSYSKPRSREPNKSRWKQNGPSKLSRLRVNLDEFEPSLEQCKKADRIWTKKFFVCLDLFGFVVFSPRM
ncbi:4763_t:CDS:1, partial [Gigaspora rosea]